MPVNKSAAKCPECNCPFSPMQIEKIISGESTICERCGFELKVGVKDFSDISPVTRNQNRNIDKPDEFYETLNPNIKSISVKNNSPISDSRVKSDEIIQKHPRINEKNILRKLKVRDWTSLVKLKNNLVVINNKELYLLRMKLNEMKRNGLVQMDFQVNRVLIRKTRSSA